MSDTDQGIPPSAENDIPLKAGDLPVQIVAQYIIDLSFENPKAIKALRDRAGTPEMDLNIGMDARKVPDNELNNLFEVVLSVNAKASKKDDVIFLAELQYGITVQIDKKVPEESHHPILLIEIPRLAFPYARQILSDLTLQAGFPPLMLAPVDFHALYMRRFGNEIKEAQKT